MVPGSGGAARFGIPRTATGLPAPAFGTPWGRRREQEKLAQARGRALAQDNAIRGISDALRGSAGGTARAVHSPEHVRSLALLAQRVLHHAAAVGHRAAALGRPVRHGCLQGALVLGWARENGLLIERERLAEAFPFSAHESGEETQMEHHVWPDATGQRVIKLTQAGHHGMWPVAQGSGWDMRTRAATPARYLSRMLAANAFLGDDWVLHAIVTDGGGQGHVQFLTSQPHYAGPVPGDVVYAAPESRQAQARVRQQRLIRQALARQGFHATAHSPSTFYRPADNLAMFDAHLHNLIWLTTSRAHDACLMPFDVVLMHPRGRLRDNIAGSVI